MNVKEAEAVVAQLEQKRIKCVARGTELADERASIALLAHADNDAKARKRLNEINSEIAVHSSELRARTHKSGSASSGSLDVRFAPKATELLRRRKMM
jgi:hypothetical protein